jgi:4-amino-4-deoxy-L-arabinose transferase-like glycosyltransferase
LHPSNLAKRGTVLLFLAVIAFYFYGLGHLPLLGPDEPRYAQVAREMFVRHDLITPTLGGHVWFEKPALLYWLMIASFKLFGVSEWAARLPSAVAGLLTIAALFVVSRQATAVAKDTESQSYAFWCVLVSATTLGLVVFSRGASFDILLTMTTTWALAFYVLYEFAVEEKIQRRCLAGFYSFIGFSLLAKGLVGIVIPFGVVGLYYLLERRIPKRSALMSVLWGVPLALIIASAWYGPVIRLHGWLFIDQFIIQQHFARYLSNKYHHSGPFYYYLLVVPPFALPWTAFLIDGLLQLKTRLWRATEVADVDRRMNRLMIFSFAWILFPLVFFSLSSSKLPGYVLPALPAAAFIIGERLWRVNLNARNQTVGIKSQVWLWPIKTTAILGVMFPVATLAYAWRTGSLSITLALLLGVPAFTAGCIAFFLRRKPVAAIAIALATVVILIVLLNRAAPAFADHQSSKRLLQLADARGYSHAPIYGLRHDDRSPEFYAPGRIVYAPDGEPVLFESIGQVVWESRRRNQTILTMAPLTDVEPFRQLSSMRVDVIGDNERVALVAIGPP